MMRPWEANGHHAPLDPTELLPTMLRFCLIVLLLALGHSGVHAARLALVVGNDQYQHISPLRNAAADAQAMAVALGKAGYQVTQRTNLDLRVLKDELRTFRRRIQGGDEVVVFFSGHGVQVGGENYLLPTDTRSDSEEQVRDDAVALSSVLADLRSARPAFTLAIIDACRDNPFQQTGKSIGGRGLTRVSSATGEMVLFAAGEGQRALDRLGNSDPVHNGVFTRVLVKEMERPGIPVDRVMRSVREQVARLAQSVGHDQVPALYDQVLGNFYFYPGNGPISPGAEQIEQQAWGVARSANNVPSYNAYLTEYPRGRFASLARVALAGLQPAPQTAAPAPAPTPAVAPSQQAGQVFKDCPDCPEMVMIPAGSFTMGSDESDTEKPPHRVSIRSFEIGRTEVTQGQWQAVMGSNPSRFNNCGNDCPVERVSWTDIQQFIQRLNARTGKTYRLPSEAEWEYAARAGSTGRWSFGGNEEQLGQHAWFGDNSRGSTQRVAQKQPNAFGLYDMHGNALEWVEDCWHNNYNGAPTDGSAWTTGCSGDWRVLRGGSWLNYPAILRSAIRSRITPDYRGDSDGFRLARTLVAP
jgi:formylglycine-generating enzyme required for sulfatase activity